VLDEHGYTLLIAHTAGDASRFDVILRRFLERRVDGVLVANPAGVGPIVAQYQDGRIPAAALISRGDGATELPLFTADMDDASAEVVERLERLGHRKVASVLPSGGHRPFGPLVRRLRASPMEVATYPRGTTADELVDACTGTERATAVLATYPVSLSILAACRRRGVMVPGDLSVVAVGDEPALANVIEQSPSAISFDLGEVGRAAGEAMLAWLGGEAPARNTLVQASAWVERGTTGPPAGRRGRAYRGR
jgi:DNA-binding LacI/PurR family transcriptional regulator